jgi:hypothetical protein
MRAGEDTVVNQELVRRGSVAYRAQEVSLIHYSPCRTPMRLIRHHFVRGRGWGRIFRDHQAQAPLVSPRRIGTLFARQVVQRLRQITRNVSMWGEGLRHKYWWSFPLVLTGAIATWAGTCYELLRGVPKGSAVPVEHAPALPGVTSPYDGDRSTASSHRER